MDTTNIEYRIRQCSKCSGDLKYFCVTCSFDLCLQCGENHIMKCSKNDIHDLILYREKFNQIRKHEICVRHPGSVYDHYCEVCKIPICTDCTEHGTHTQTDVGTAYAEKHRNREIIKTIKYETLPNCVAFQTSIEINFKTGFSDEVNSEMRTHLRKLLGCLDNVLHNFNVKHRCLKQKMKMKKYIARTSIYEQKYEHSSDAPIHFLLSIKKHHLTCSKIFLHSQGTISTFKSLKAETDTVIENLLTIKLTNKRIHLTETELVQHLNAVLMKMARNPRTMLAFMKEIPKIISRLPWSLAG